MNYRRVITIFLLVSLTIIPGWSLATDDEPTAETYTHPKPFLNVKETTVTSPGLQLGTAAPAEHTFIVDPQTIATEIARVKARDLDSKRKLIGAHIALPEIAAEKWERLTGADGVHSWRLAIRSAGATQLRAHFTGYDPELKIVVYGEPPVETAREAKPTRTATTPDFWGPIVAGEVLYIEVITERATPPAGLIDKISHAFTDFQKKAAAGDCYLDPTCYNKWVDVRDSIGQMYFEVTADGGMAVCTGTLIMDQQSSYQPWFISAHHCISTEADADTLQVSFFYYTDSCNGDPANWSSTPYTEGAKIYYKAASDEEIDITLFQLDQDPPDGTVYAGWTTSGQADNDDVTVLHHPGGDFMRISFGSIVASYPLGGSGYSGFWEVEYRESSTEPGSSGSGLFTGNARLIGTLSAGDASCDNMAGSDLYGQFRAAWDDGLRDVLGDDDDDSGGASTGGSNDDLSAKDDEDDTGCGCGD